MVPLLLQLQQRLAQLLLEVRELRCRLGPRRGGPAATMLLLWRQVQQQVLHLAGLLVLLHLPLRCILRKSRTRPHTSSSSNSSSRH